jgi:hypothetical protein
MSTEIETMVDVKRAFAAKVARGMFQPVARHLRSDIAEDRLAEGIAMAFELFAKSAAAGHPVNDAILVHRCHMRAIDLSRRVAGAGGAHPKRDVLDERNYHAGHLEIVSLDVEFEDMEGQATLGFDEPEIPNPARRLVSAMDLETWLSSLAAEDRLLLALRQAGHTLNEMAAVTGRSITAVRVRLLALGRELAERAGVDLAA